jgi:hypothetical protein
VGEQEEAEVLDKLSAEDLRVIREFTEGYKVIRTIVHIVCWIAGLGLAFAAFGDHLTAILSRRH